MRVLMAATLLVGCAGDELPSLDMQPLSVQTEAPIAGFSVRDDGVWIVPGTLEGFVGDDDQAASTLLVEVRSVRDGLLYYGNPEPDGRWAWEGELSLGDNPVEVTVVDREGNMTAESTLLRVRTNEAPRCTIVSPRDGEQLAARTDVTFEARVSDADGDPVDVLWQSSLEGALAAGNRFVLRLRDPGTHVISVEALDPFGGVCTDAVSVVVR